MRAPDEVRAPVAGAGFQVRGQVQGGAVTWHHPWHQTPGT